MANSYIFILIHSFRVSDLCCKVQEAGRKRKSVSVLPIHFLVHLQILGIVINDDVVVVYVAV